MENTTKQDINNWSINRATRFLIYKADSPYEVVYTSLRGNKELQEIYRELGLKLWGSVGRDDLLEGVA